MSVPRGPKHLLQLIVSQVAQLFKNRFDASAVISARPARAQLGKTPTHWCLQKCLSDCDLIRTDFP